MSHFESHIEQILATLRDEQALRTLTPIELLEDGHYAALNDAHPQPLINLNSNDYLALHDASCHFADETDPVSYTHLRSIAQLFYRHRRLHR